MADLELYSRLAERHGHYCPMSTLGVRLGEEAVRLLRADPQVEMELSYLAKTCAADGIRIVFESADINNELQVEPLGQHLLRCRIAGDKELSWQFTDEAMRLAAGYRQLDEQAKPQHLEMLRTIAAERLIAQSEGPIS